MKKYISHVMTAICLFTAMSTPPVRAMMPNDNTINLLSGDEQIVVMPTNIVHYLPTINDLLKSLGDNLEEISEGIPVGPVSAANLELIINAVQDIDQKYIPTLTQYSNFFKEHGLNAIPNHVSGTVYPLLKNKNKQELVNLMNDANYLAMDDWFMNAVARYWVIQKGTVKSAQKLGLTQDIINIHIKPHMQTETLNPLSLNPLSVADLVIADQLPQATFIKEQPSTQIQAFEGNTLDLSNKGLTSSIGLELIPTDVASSIKLLDLSNNYLTTIQSHAFSKFKILTRLNLSNNLLSYIDPTALDYNDNLTSINLDRNQLSSIVPGTFKNLKRLDDLSLADNQFKTIQSGWFDGAYNLGHLDFSNNQIRSITPGALSSLPELQYLRLRNNLLKDIAPQALTGPMQFDLIELFGNPIKNIQRTITKILNAGIPIDPDDIAFAQ